MYATGGCIDINVDIVFVIDATDSLHTTIDSVKAAALSFHETLNERFKEAAKKGCRPEMYPENMPEDLSEFYNVWQANSLNQSSFGSDGESTKLDPTGHRLVLFAPNEYPWTDMEVDIDYTLREPIEAGKGGPQYKCPTVVIPEKSMEE